jgi:hypothetical protein
MKKQSWQMLISVAVLIAFSAGLVVYLQYNQRLGEPGLKISEMPIHDPEGNVVGTNSVYLPLEVAGYSSSEVPVTQLELDWLPKDTMYGRRVYTAEDGFQSMISIVLMGADRTSIHQPQYCLTGQGWVIDRSEMVTIPMNHPHPYDLPAMKLTVSRQHRTSDGQEMTLRGVYVYWFVADNQLTNDHMQRMWWMARDLVFKGVLQRWAYVTYFSVCAPGGEELLFERMKEFIATTAPDFQLAAGAPLASGGAGSPGPNSVTASRSP